MNKNVVVFSFAVAAAILFILLFSILAILYFYWGNTEAVKDSLSTVSGLFGGITTLGAAVVASYLFNDWRDQHNKTVSNDYAKKVLDSYDHLSKEIRDFTLKFYELESDLFEIYLSFQLKDHKDMKEYHEKTESIKRTTKALNTYFHFFIRNLEHYQLLSKDSNTPNTNVEILKETFQKITDITLYTVEKAIQFEDFINLCRWAKDGYDEIEHQINNEEIKKIIKSLKV